MSTIERVKVFLRNHSTHPLLLPAYLLWRRGKLRDRPFNPIAGMTNVMFARPSFSQYGEDLVLGTLFQGVDRGFYVDVGCFHPFLISNTFLLHRRGWRGINIDPIPRTVRAFQRHRPDDTTLQLAVTEEAGWISYDFNGVFSTIHDGDASDDGPEPSEGVRALPLSDILAEHVPHGHRIDLLDVDCEGHDLEVLRSNDWERWRPSVILAEWQGDTTRDEIACYLEPFGYQLIVTLHMTGVFASEEFRSSAPARAS